MTAPLQRLTNLRATFPAIERLDWARRGERIRFVRQVEVADCGVACLVMVLRFHGRHVTLEEVRRAVGRSGSGTTLGELVRAAELFQLRGRAFTLDIDDLGYLPCGAILHWEFRHFVVFERLCRGGVVILDPVVGRRRVPLEAFRKSFTGVVAELIPTERFQKRKRSGNPALEYFRALFGQQRTLSRVVLSSFTLRVFGMASPVVTGLVIDQVIPRRDTHLLWVLVAGLGSIIIAQLITGVVRAHLMLQLRTNLDTRLILGFVDYLASLPFSFFQRRSAGDLMSRIASNSAIREVITSGTMSGLLDGVSVCVYLALLLIADARFGAIVAVLGLFNVAVFLSLRRRSRQLMTESLEAQAKQQSYLVQMFAGMEALKSSGAEGRAVERWSNLWVDELNVSLERGRMAAAVEAIQGVLGAATPLTILLYGAYSVISHDLSLGMMLAFNSLAMNFLGPLRGLAGVALRLQDLGSYIERIDDVFQVRPEQQEPQRPAHRLSGGLSLDGVSFRYDEHGPIVVQDVNIEIEAGSSVALVGRSGSGKSTLAKLLLGLYEPTTGSVRYDGAALRDMDLRSVRQQVGVVSQGSYVFGGTIRENLALSAPDAPLDALVRAATTACIDADIRALPLQYDAPVGEGGSSLSGGQKQRLALARALVGDPALLLLDEATSALDSETESAIIRNLSRLRCTRIFIAHRLSTIVSADKILVMEAGRVVESGKHHDLMAMRGRYSDLVRAQTKSVGQ